MTEAARIVKGLTMFRYIHFVKVGEKPRTSVWSCRNNRNGAELGRVKWHPPWRQYCYFPAASTVFSSGCLADIETFIRYMSTGEVSK
jgi:hypothetical protein